MDRKAGRRSDTGMSASTETACFHCGEVLPPGAGWHALVDGESRPMCCVGCEAAALAIVGFGLGAYYRQRDALAKRPDSDATEYAVFDDPAITSRYVRICEGLATAELVIGGMSCAACAWLLEQRLAALPGLRDCELNYATAKLEVTWMPGQTSLAAVCQAVAEIGFDARPYSPDERRAADARLARDLLSRLGVSLIFGMQVMSISLALYFGAEDASTGLERFLRAAALVLTLPVIAYSATPFFRAAWSALRMRSLNMDVPVSLAIVTAFVGSVWHVLVGEGTIYFDSIVMFASLLLLTRWLELRARVRAASRLEGLTALVPESVARILGEGSAARIETVPAVTLATGDRIRVRPGEVIAADGVIESGASTVDEALLSGESEPLARSAGQPVLAGSTNIESPLDIRVTAVGADAFAGQLSTLVGRAAASRPTEAEPLGWVVRYFVFGVLLCATGTLIFWRLHDPANALGAVLAVLVVSCPCALAIARPAALAAAHSSLLGAGVAVLNRGALERLGGITDWVFDKTGTLTSGRLQLLAIQPLGETSGEELLDAARALSEGATHPVASALREHAPARQGRAATGIVADTGLGVRGEICSRQVVMGKLDYVTRELEDIAPAVDIERVRLDDAAALSGKEAWVAISGRLAGRLSFSDGLRQDAVEALARLRSSGLKCHLLSGDRPESVEQVARQCGLELARAEQTPEMKLGYVNALQAAACKVVMVGDGINDSPVMAGADVSIAVVDATALTRQQADILLLAPRLILLADALLVARRLRVVVRQNFAWAVTYNLLAIPLAMSGQLPPWAAAAGMSLSSLLVVLNALRARVPAREIARPA